MRFVYYTEKTVAQCMLALNERLQTKSSRSSLEGWVEKSGKFSLSVTSSVIWRFKRTTRLQAKAERQSGLTTIKGDVSNGVGPRERVIILVALALVGLFLILTGSTLPGVIVIGAGLLLLIPLTGDYDNSQTLLGEIQRTLKARPTPPAVGKKTGDSRSNTAQARRPTAAPTTKKPPPAARKTAPSSSTRTPAKPPGR